VLREVGVRLGLWKLMDEALIDPRERRIKDARRFSNTGQIRAPPEAARGSAARACHCDGCGHERVRACAVRFHRAVERRPWTEKEGA
jgi:hypothetical protein